MAEPNATRKEMVLTGVQRAAVVLLSLGEDQAAEVLKHMGAKEVQKLGLAMTSVGGISREAVAGVFDEFVDVLAQPSALGSGADDYIRAVLTQALGEERASSLIDRILAGRNTSGLDTLKWMEPRAIVDLVRNEHPQIIAIVMAHLDPDQAADVIKLLPDRVRPDVLLRIGLGGLAVLLLIFTVLRPAFRQLLAPKPQTAIATVLPQDEEIPVVLSSTPKPKKEHVTAQAAMNFDEKLQVAKTAVSNDPKRVANVMRNWVENDG